MRWLSRRQIQQVALSASLCANLLLPFSSFAQPSDGDGDPLPPGAVARLGTKWWRHRDEAQSLNWSPDGRTLAFISSFREIRLLDAESGKLISAIVPTLPDGTRIRSFDIAISPDGKELAVRSFGRLNTFDIGTGKHIQTFKVELSDFGEDGGRVCYSSDRKHLAFAEGSDFAVIDRVTGETVIQEDTKAEIQGLSFTSDSSRLMVASLKPSLKVWSLAKREVEATWNYDDNFFVWGPAVSPDGKLVAVGHTNVMVVDPFGGKETVRLSGDDPRDLFLFLAFSPDGRLLIAGSQEGTVYVWNTSDWSRRAKLTSDARVLRGMDVSPDGKRLAVGDAGHRIWVFSLETNKLLFDEKSAHDGMVEAAQFSPDGKLLATASGGLDTHVWDTATWQHVRRFNYSGSALAFSEDSQSLVSTWYGNRRVRILAVSSGDDRTALEGSGEAVMAMQLSADRSHLATICIQRKPQKWRISRYRFPSFEPAGELETTEYQSMALALSADGQYAATSGMVGMGRAAEPTVFLWDLESQKLVSTLMGHGHYAEAILFSPDDRQLITGSLDQTIRVWELASRQSIHVLKGHKRSLAALAISPDGRVLASAGGHKSYPIEIDDPHKIRFWDLATGKQITTLSGHQEDVKSLAFSPDGKTLVSGLRDTTAIVWDVPPEVFSRDRVQRQLTEAKAGQLWESLERADAKDAHAAMLELMDDPVQTLLVARSTLRPVQPLEPREFNELLAQLDGDGFAVRKLAFDRLASFGGRVAEPMAHARKDTRSAEVRLRLGELLALANDRFAPASITPTRQVQVLESIGTEDARAILQELSRGVSEAPLTKEAVSALKRLEMRQKLSSSAP
jgi:WD40 repeat protein